MLQLKVKITKADIQEGVNKYGESYRGYQCIGMEQDVPEGQWQNKVPFFTREEVRVGDIGTVQVNIDIRQYNGRDFADVKVINWNPIEVAGY